MKKIIFSFASVSLIALGSYVAPSHAVENTKNLSGYSVVSSDGRSSLKENENLAQNSLIDSNSSAYSDADIIAFLLYAKGPIAENNPEAVSVATKNEMIQQVSLETAYAVANNYLNYNKNFSEEIRSKLTSNSPIEVEDGIRNFSDSFINFVQQDSTVGSRMRSKGMEAQGCSWSGCVKSNAYALTNAAVVWQAVGIHTVGAVTIAAAAAVIVAVYLPGDPEASQIERQNETKELMNALQR